MNCLTDKITADIAINCDHLAIAGIESDILLVAHEDIDWTATTYDATNSMIISDLVLKAGKTGFVLQGVKQTNGFNSEFVPGDDQTLDKHRHGIRGRILSPTAVNIEQANKLTKGTPYVAVVNRKYKGVDSKDAFIFLGKDQGMYVSVMTINSNENDSAILIEMASKDGMLENDLPRIVLDTDYDTTVTAFANKFLQPEV